MAILKKYCSGGQALEWSDDFGAEVPQDMRAALVSVSARLKIGCLGLFAKDEEDGAFFFCFDKGPCSPLNRAMTTPQHVPHTSICGELSMALVRAGRLEGSPALPAPPAHSAHFLVELMAELRPTWGDADARSTGLTIPRLALVTWLSTELVKARAHLPQRRGPSARGARLASHVLPSLPNSCAAGVCACTRRVRVRRRWRRARACGVRRRRWRQVVPYNKGPPHKGKCEWPKGMPSESGGHNTYEDELAKTRAWLSHSSFCPTKYPGLRALQDGAA